MSYRLLDPLHRSRSFRLFEEKDPLHRDRVFWVTESAFARDLVRGGKPKSGVGKLLGWDKKTKFIDRVQDTVDIIGVIDPTGIADGANALAYASRGKWKDAAVSAMGMVPYLGDVAKLTKVGKGAKLGGKAAKVEKEAAKLASKKAAKRAAQKEGGSLGKEAMKALGKTRFVRGMKAGVGRKIGRYGRAVGKAVTGQGKLRGKAAKAAEIGQRVQDFRQTGAGKKIEKGLRDRVSGGPEKQQPQQPDEKPKDTGAPERSFLSKVTGAAAGVAGAAGAAGAAASGGRKEEPEPKPQPQDEPQDERPNARPDVQAPPPEKGGTRSTDRPEPEPASPARGAERGGGGSSTGPRGATIVPLDGKCPPPKTKTSTDRAGGGKRCNKQTIPRDH